MEKLLAKRAKMEKEVTVEASAFSWKVMGGPWAKKHLGVDFNSFRAASCSADAQRFCCQYSLCLSASFTLALYGEAVAQTLAEYWVLKMSYFYQIWCERGSGKHVFSASEIMGFAEPQGFTNVLRGADGKIVARMRALQRLLPGLPK